MMIYHRFPFKDIKQHVVYGKEGDDGQCWCEPKKMYENGCVIYLHQSKTGTTWTICEQKVELAERK